MNIEISNLKFWDSKDFEKDAKENPFCNMGVQPLFGINGLFNATISFDYQRKMIVYNLYLESCGYGSDGDSYEEPMTEEGYNRIKIYAERKYMDCISKLCKTR